MRSTFFGKVLPMILALVLVLSCLTACSSDEDTEPEPSPAPTGETIIPGYENGYDASEGEGDEGAPPVDFGLQDGGDPVFSDLGTGVDEGLYTIENGYAYALDPTTFDKVGPPLDPVTHEPIGDAASDDGSVDASGEGSGEGDTTGEGEGNGEGAEGSSDEGSNGISDQTKLPNTGIFLEDD